jgi:hypothetical protein
MIKRLKCLINGHPAPTEYEITVRRDICSRCGKSVPFDTRGLNLPLWHVVLWVLLLPIAGAATIALTIADAAKMLWRNRP